MDRTQEEVLRAVETRNELHNILRSRQKRWIGHTLRHDCLVRTVEGRLQGKKGKNKVAIIFIWHYQSIHNKYHRMHIYLVTAAFSQSPSKSNLRKYLFFFISSICSTYRFLESAELQYINLHFTQLLIMQIFMARFLKVFLLYSCYSYGDKFCHRLVVRTQTTLDQHVSTNHSLL